MQMHRWSLALVCAALVLPPALSRGELQVGAAKVDVTPQQLPVLVNGNMTSRLVDRVATRVSARAIVLDDGSTQIALVVVDSCLMPRILLDEAKANAAAVTGIAADHIMISATHTHTAPSVMAALGTEADQNYIPVLRRRIVESILAAKANLTPAEVGWSVGSAPEFTALRRWVRRPDRLDVDPFGNATVRANMHAASNLDNVVGPSGPEDPTLSLISFRSIENRSSIAVLANFSMHYFGDQDISADYFGRFCDGFEVNLQSENAEHPPVAVMSHGCSGDIWRRDYANRQPVAEGTIEQFSSGLLAIATQAHAETQYSADGTLAMVQESIPLKYRTPDKQRLAWSREIVDAMGDRLPETRPEIYAREQVYLDQMQSTSVIVQAIRIGDIAIATTPTETYALTGLKLKLQSPFEKTMVIELANGGDGYIPPPEQHLLGGYNTWPARSAGLEVDAEPKIVAALLKRLEQVCESSRRTYHEPDGSASAALLRLQPTAYWRLGELSGLVAQDSGPARNHAHIERGALFFLDGDPTFTLKADSLNQANRCMHLVESRLRWKPSVQTGDDQWGKNGFMTAFSFWNGLVLDSRPTAAWLFSCDSDLTTTSSGLHVGIGGSERAGRLVLQVGEEVLGEGRSDIPRWVWHRVAIVVFDGRIRVYLDNASVPQIDVATPIAFASLSSRELFWGGRSDKKDCLEGRLDEVVLLDHAADTRVLENLLLVPRP